MKPVSFRKALASYSLYQILAYCASIHLSQSASLSSLLLPCLSSSLIIIILSAHYTLYAQDKKWHWITPTLLLPWLFPEMTYPSSSSLALYIHLLVCTVTLSIGIATLHTILFNATYSALLLLLCRQWLVTLGFYHLTHQLTLSYCPWKHSTLPSDYLLCPHRLFFCASTTTPDSDVNPEHGASSPVNY